MSVIHALSVVRCGDNWNFTGPLNDQNGNALNLTGASLTWHLESLDGKTTYITLTLGSGITVISPTAGTVMYGPNSSDTASLSPGTYYDCLHVTLSDGETFTVVEGFINALPAI